MLQKTIIRIHHIECGVLRGASVKKLYITSVGGELDLAKEYILKMHGIYRIPTLLKQLDQISKQV